MHKHSSSAKGGSFQAAGLVSVEFLRHPRHIFPIDSSPSVILQGRSTGRVRGLHAFQKYHRVPDSVNDAAQGFIRKVGNNEIKTLADDLFRDIRAAFSYKRKEFDYSCDAGEAWVKTPDFDASIRIDQSIKDPTLYVIYTELLKLHNEAIAADPRLHTCFDAHCDRLLVTFPSPIQVEDKIDLIEDLDDLAQSMTYEPDGSRFELRLPNLDLQIEVDAFTMSFSLLTLRNLGKLIRHSQRAFTILTECGFKLQYGIQD